MKKTILKSTMVVIISIGFVNYLIYLKTGQMPIANYLANFSDSLTMPRFSDLTASVKEGALADRLGSVKERVSSGGETRVYKWTDEQGVVHYSQESPPDSSAEEIVVDVNTNLVKGMAPEDFAPTDAKPAGGRAHLISDDASRTDSGVNPDSPPIEQAQQAKKMLEQRNQEQQKILDAL